MGNCRHWASWSSGGGGCALSKGDLSRACPRRKCCPNQALMSLSQSWNVGAPSGSRPSGPGSQRSQLRPSSGLGLRAGEGPSSNCCHLLSSPPFPPLPCLGEPQSSSAAWWETGPPLTSRGRARTLSLRLCLAESYLEQAWDCPFSGPQPTGLEMKGNWSGVHVQTAISVGRIGVEKSRLRLEWVGGGTTWLLGPVD